MSPEVLRAINAAREANQPAVLVTDVEDGAQRLLVGAALTSDPLAEAAQSGLRMDRTEVHAHGGRRWLLQPFNPPLRLLIVGAVHIAQPLARIAALLGYAVTVVDPRTAFARAERFSNVEVITEWPDDALSALALDTRTAVVTLTHDPKLDDPALEVALKSGVFYIGCLGSKRTHAARLGRLERAGFAPEALARIHGPVGLPIGARSPAEIAVSIVAQMTEALRKATP